MNDFEKFREALERTGQVMEYAEYEHGGYFIILSCEEWIPGDVVYDFDKDGNLEDVRITED